MAISFNELFSGVKGKDPFHLLQRIPSKAPRQEITGVTVKTKRKNDHATSYPSALVYPKVIYQSTTLSGVRK